MLCLYGVVNRRERESEQIRTRSFIEIVSHFVGRRNNSFDLYLPSLVCQTNGTFFMYKFRFLFFTADCFSNGDLCNCNALKLFSVCIREILFEVVQVFNFEVVLRIWHMNRCTISPTAILPARTAQMYEGERKSNITFE